MQAINDFGELAVHYYKKLIANSELPNTNGWEVTARDLGFSNSMVKKGCPKNAFLGLCSAGLIKDIPDGNYTRSIKNRAYAEICIKILKENDELKKNPKDLWEKIPNKPKTYNHQMDVVCALWNEGLIV